MRIKSKVLGGVFWLVAEKLLRLFATVPVTLLIARTVGPGDFGKLGYALGLTGIAMMAAQLGLDRLLRRDFAALRERSGPHFATSIGLSALAALASAALLCGYAATSVSDPLTRQLIYLLALGVLPQCLLPAEYWFQAVGGLRRVTTLKLGLLLLCAGARIWICLVRPDVRLLALVAALEWTLTAVAVLWLFRRSGGAPRDQNFRPGLALSWLSENWAFFGLALITAFFDRMDLIVLNHAGDAEQLGLYTAAQRFSELFFTFSTTAAAAFLPWLARHRQLSEESYQIRLQWYLDASFAIPLCVALVATALAPFFVSLFYGHRYDGAGLLLVLLCWSGPATYTEVARSQILVTERLVKYDAAFNLIQAVLFLPLAIFSVSRWGALGVCGTRLLCTAFSCWVLPFLFRRTRHIGWMQLRAFGFLLRTRAFAEFLLSLWRSRGQGM